MSDPEHSDIRGDDDLVAHSEIENRHHSSPPYQPDEQDLAEITLLTAELDEAEKFDLTFECYFVVDKELDENEYATVRVPDSNIEEENDENNENIENEITQMAQNSSREVVFNKPRSVHHFHLEEPGKYYTGSQENRY
uniref:Reverse transcriptase domain-containing protein n=1 Tax=Heterorhabditis bacteriophora TaxID=37862 RepID=A0A1I7X475_HETBA